MMLHFHQSSCTNYLLGKLEILFDNKIEWPLMSFESVYLYFSFRSFKTKWLSKLNIFSYDTKYRDTIRLVLYQKKTNLEPFIRSEAVLPPRDNEKKWLPSTTTTNILEMACYTHTLSLAHTLTHTNTRTLTRTLTFTHTHIHTLKSIWCMEWNEVQCSGWMTDNLKLFFSWLIYRRPFHKVILGTKLRYLNSFLMKRKKTCSKE